MTCREDGSGAAAGSSCCGRGDVAVGGEGSGDCEWAVVGVVGRNAPGGSGPVEVRLTGGRPGDPLTLGLADVAGRTAFRLPGLGEGLRLRAGGLRLPTLPA